MTESPPAPLPEEVTGLLRAAEAGDRDALDRVFSVLYGELRAIAHRQLRAAPAEQTLSTTALVHETYLKLSRGAGWSAKDRSHFFSLAARAMRMILVDQARSRTRQRRGSGRRPLDLENVEIPVEERAAEIVALDEALLKLGEVDGDLAQIVEWRFFAGLSVEEIAEMSGRSERTIKRHWQAARAFLFQELSAGEAGS
ncbi:MAG TPA: ECF-type sigma factor [Thermoanaerobaculia bacterium]|nr:ECF-type sigma factor [Thermoanaerobaculia bacterium]